MPVHLSQPGYVPVSPSLFPMFPPSLPLSSLRYPFSPYLTCSEIRLLLSSPCTFLPRPVSPGLPRYWPSHSTPRSGGVLSLSPPLRSKRFDTFPLSSTPPKFAKSASLMFLQSHPLSCPCILSLFHTPWWTPGLRRFSALLKDFPKGLSRPPSPPYQMCYLFPTCAFLHFPLLKVGGHELGPSDLSLSNSVV